MWKKLPRNFEYSCDKINKTLKQKNGVDDIDKSAIGEGSAMSGIKKMKPNLPVGKKENRNRNFEDMD